MDKRIKEISIDRLSALPDSLIFDILDRLELKEAVITSVLSKRWLSLWADLPCLDFREFTVNPEKNRRFVSLINTALANRTTNSLYAFSVQFNYNSNFASDINRWLELAVVNYKTQRLKVLFAFCNCYHELPETMYFTSSLKYASLTRCRFIAPIEWPSLVSLELDDVMLGQNVIDGILSNCPVLETLKLLSCWGFRYLEINSPRLSSFEIYVEYNVEIYELEISAPYLTDLNINWSPTRRKLHLKNLSSLAIAKIEFNTYLDEVVLPSTLEQLFQQLQRVRNLVLGPKIFKYVSGMLNSGCRLQLSSVQALCLKGLGDGILDREISCVVGLLDSSPKLEDLTITYDRYYYSDKADRRGPRVREDVIPDFSNLKSVVLICRCVSDKRLLTMSRILLKRAIVLEKMEIVLSCRDPRQNLTRITQKLQSYPRTSQIAQVLIVKSE